MVRIKVIARANYNRRKKQFHRRPRSGVKNIEGRIRNRGINIKQIIPQSRHIDVKKMDKLLDEWL